MAFADPQVIDVDGDDNQTLNRVRVDPTSTTFRTENGIFEFVISHQYAKRTRRLAKLTMNSSAVDPYHADTNVPYSISVSMVIDAPNAGVEPASQAMVAKALLAYLSSTSYQPLTKFISGQL